MRFKKSVALLVIISLALTFSLVGCNSNPDQKEVKEEVKKEVKKEVVDKYPERPVKFIVPFNAGGASDRFCRTLAPYLKEQLGVDVVVENRPGAGSQVGLTLVADSDGEGYVIGQFNQPQLSFTHAVQKASYSMDDFAILNFQQIDPVILNVLKDKPWKDINEFFDYIREHPGEVKIGCTQMSGPHLLMYYLQEKFNLDFNIVPYDGGGAGRAALLGGHVDAYFAQAFANYTIKDQTRGLIYGWDERSELWPDVPTFNEVFGDEEVNKVAKAMAAYRGLLVPNKFKEKYPERFNKLVEAYNNAYHSEGHMADAEKTGQKPIMHWIGPEESKNLAKETNNLVLKYAKYFE